jgi:ATP-dependent metalloprotease FtsH
MKRKKKVQLQNVSYPDFLKVCANKSKLWHVPQDVRVSNKGTRYKYTLVSRKVAAEAVAPLKISAYTDAVAGLSPDMINFFSTNNINYGNAPTPVTSKFFSVVVASIPITYLIFMIKLMSNMNSNGGEGGSVGNAAKNVGKRFFPNRRSSSSPTTPSTYVSFDDVAGIDAAKYEVMELVDCLRNPAKYAKLGARAPTGLLLHGPPGTGKTLLAKATASSANVPILYCSGSDFVEMYVGRGAARVRKTFARAAKLAPCIIFIDELDALGKARSTNSLSSKLGGNNDEQEQTLNQVLACMDGLNSMKGICVLAATNRLEIIDSALTRPGRFDRIVKLELPDAAGRVKILKVHAKKVKGGGERIAFNTAADSLDGCSGADLEYIVNEAAIRAVRRVTSAQTAEGGVGGANEDDVGEVLQCDFDEAVADFYIKRRKSNPFFNLLG